MPKTRKTRSIYGVHPSMKMIANWIAGLKEKTGRTLEQWAALIRKDGPDEVPACRDWLKAQHGFGANQAWWLAECAWKDGWHDGDPDAYLKRRRATSAICTPAPRRS